MSEVISVEDFHKAYDATVATCGLSFQVQAGEVLGLIGPNGAGKTTTLRALAGIIAPSRGRLTVCGFNLGNQALSAKQRLAYIPDDPQLFSDLTVEQHLAFVAGVYRVDDADAKGAQLLEEFELTAKRRTPARDLSRGMRQKLAVCCAYLHDPQAILFDEPLTGLDPHGIRSLKQTIIERSRQGSAVIVSSHLLAMVEDICSHVLILSEGQQRYFGRLQDVRSAFGEADSGVSLEEIFFRATAPTKPELASV